jgi:hypothetical protein
LFIYNPKLDTFLFIEDNKEENKLKLPSIHAPNQKFIKIGNSSLELASNLTPVDSRNTKLNFITAYLNITRSRMYNYTVIASLNASFQSIQSLNIVNINRQEFYYLYYSAHLSYHINTNINFYKIIYNNNLFKYINTILNEDVKLKLIQKLSDYIKNNLDTLQFIPDYEFDTYKQRILNMYQENKIREYFTEQKYTPPIPIQNIYSELICRAYKILLTVDKSGTRHLISEYTQNKNETTIDNLCKHFAKIYV